MMIRRTINRAERDALLGLVEWELGGDRPAGSREEVERLRDTLLLREDLGWEPEPDADIFDLSVIEGDLERLLRHFLRIAREHLHDDIASANRPLLEDAPAYAELSTEERESELDARLREAHGANEELRWRDTCLALLGEASEPNPIPTAVALAGHYMAARNATKTLARLAGQALNGEGDAGLLRHAIAVHTTTAAQLAMEAGGVVEGLVATSEGAEAATSGA